jgi:hypothetical protein
MRFFIVKGPLQKNTKMRLWFFVFASIWVYNSSVFASTTDEINGKSPHKTLFQAHLRKVAELNLKDRFNPSIFVSYSWDSEEYKRRIEAFCEDLEKAGIPANQILLDQWANRPGGSYDLHQFMERIPNSDKVLLFGSPELKRKYEAREAYPGDAGIVSHEINLLRNRIVARGIEDLIPAWFEGQFEDSFPVSLHHISGRQLDIYFFKLFDLLGDIYQTIYPTPQNPIIDIRDKFEVRQSRLRTISNSTEFLSVSGSFPQSLRAYNAFLDRTNDQGLSYLDVIFEELFMNENEEQFSTLTLCALSGLGGVGKTTLATEFSHKYAAFYNFIYRLEGGSREELLNSCLCLLDTLKFPVIVRDRKTYFSDIICLVNEKLSKLHYWLLIIDNVEDPELVADLSPQNGHILCTSRHSNWHRKLDIDAFKRAESIAFLLQLTGLNPRFADQAEILAEELGDLPLALAQAVAYIKQQQLPTFEAYLGIYKASQIDLLAKQQLQPSLNKRTAVVMTTWNATMQKLSPEAQQLMTYFSYLAPAAIPMQLFQEIENCREIFEELSLYSMIKDLGDSISIHRLVQFVGRTRKQILKQEKSIHYPIDLLLEDLYKIELSFWQNQMQPQKALTKESAHALYKFASQFIPHITHPLQHIEELKSKSLFETDSILDIGVNYKALESILNGLIKVTRRYLYSVIDFSEEDQMMGDFIVQDRKIDLLTWKETSAITLPVLGENIKGLQAAVAIEKVAQLPIEEQKELVEVARNALSSIGTVEEWKSSTLVGIGAYIPAEIRKKCMLKMLPSLQNIGSKYDIISRLSPAEEEAFTQIKRFLLTSNITEKQSTSLTGAMSNFPLKHINKFIDVFLPLLVEEVDGWERINAIEDVIYYISWNYSDSYL